MTTITTSTAVTAPSRRQRDWLKLISFVPLIIGLIDTIYLSYIKLAHVEAFCPKDGSFNCDLVQGSVYGQIAGIPLGYIGLAGYLAILAVLLLEGRVAFFTQRGPLIVFAMTLFGFLYSAYLTSIEAFVLRAWCMYCLLSAAMMTLLFIFAAVRAWRQFSVVPDDLEVDEATN